MDEKKKQTLRGKEIKKYKERKENDRKSIDCKEKVNKNNKMGKIKKTRRKRHRKDAKRHEKQNCKIKSTATTIIDIFKRKIFFFFRHRREHKGTNI